MPDILTHFIKRLENKLGRDVAIQEILTIAYLELSLECVYIVYGYGTGILIRIVRAFVEVISNPSKPRKTIQGV
jgi:hypothetical protein